MRLSRGAFVILFLMGFGLVAALCIAGTEYVVLRAGPSLQMAAGNGDTALMKRWLRWGADIDASESLTALGQAAVSGQAQTVQWLLDRGADPNARDATGHTALYWAATAEQSPIAERLRAAGAVYSLRDAVNLGDLQSVQRILEQQPKELDRLTSSSGVLLGLEIWSADSADVLKALLEHGLDPNMALSDPNRSLLGLAVSEGRESWVALLLEHGGCYRTQAEATQAESRALLHGHDVVVNLVRDRRESPSSSLGSAP